MPQLISVKQASKWASEYLDSPVTVSNISYLIQYGRVKKHHGGGNTLVNLDELKEYYQNNRRTREKTWKKELGEDLNWALSFDDVRERERTKHVHRIHPYKGKFIPQLVKYFIDDHTDRFKKRVFFRPGDVILDPFCGSGTALVQANELGIHSIGIDVSEFNCLISKCKLEEYDINKVRRSIYFLIDKLEGKLPLASPGLGSALKQPSSTSVLRFANELQEKMNEFNYKHFPNSRYKYMVNRGEIDEEAYSKEKEDKFLNDVYQPLLTKYSITPYTCGGDSFLDKWYMDNIKQEMEFIKSYLDRGKDMTIIDLLKIILSRTIRSCRATTHSDLARLKEPQTTPYYCYKHKKICIPLYSLRDKFKRYSVDTLNRIKKFDQLRKNVEFTVIVGDSRKVDIFNKVEEQNRKLNSILKKKKIRGIFTSPPYVGQIDYHEQHAYAYELFDFERRDRLEIGPLFRGRGPEARDSYVEGISEVLKNCKRFLTKGYDIFLVANDKFNLYPAIAKKAGMKIVNQYKRPVLNRTSRDRNPYSEIIFHIKKK